MSDLSKFILFYTDDEEEERKKEAKSDKVDYGRVDYMVLKT